MIKRTSTGKRLNRFFDQCGVWLPRSHRVRLWVHLTGHREGNNAQLEMLCVRCLPPAHAQALYRAIGTQIVKPMK